MVTTFAIHCYGKHFIIDVSCCNPETYPIKLSIILTNTYQMPEELADRTCLYI